MDSFEPYYFSTIKKLLLENRCPVCVYGDESKKTYLKWFDIEHYNSLPAMIEISNKGLCREHGWQISLLGNKLSVLNQFVTDEKLVILKQLRTILQANRKSTYSNKISLFIDALNKQYSAQKCPVCESIKQGEQRALAYLANFLKSEKGQKVYQDSPSLCWRHLSGLLSEAPLELKLFLTDIHIEQLKKLELESDSKEEEFTWLKGLRFYVGEKPP